MRRLLLLRPRFGAACLWCPGPKTSSTLLAPTPPMGWNSWDSYGLTINEADYKSQCEVVPSASEAVWLAICGHRRRLVPQKPGERRQASLAIHGEQRRTLHARSQPLSLCCEWCWIQTPGRLCPLPRAQIWAAYHSRHPQRGGRKEPAHRAAATSMRRMRPIPPTPAAGILTTTA